MIAGSVCSAKSWSLLADGHAMSKEQLFDDALGPGRSKAYLKSERLWHTYLGVLGFKLLLYSTFDPGDTIGHT